MDKKASWKKLKAQRLESIKNNSITPEVSRYKSAVKSHKTLYTLIKLMRILNGNKLEIMGNSNLEFPKDRAVIIAPTHVRKQDIEIIMEAIPEHMYLLSGDYENVHGTVSGMMLEKNGIVYFDMKDKEDRQSVKYVIKDVLNAKINLLWFYEGSWNLSKNKPYYNGYYHMVEAAYESNALVLPVSFDLIDKTSYVYLGDFIDYNEIFSTAPLTKEQKIEGLDLIKGQLGKGLFEIWEKFSKVSRKDISPSYWDEYKKKTLGEWKFDEQDIKDKHFYNKSQVSSRDAFSHLTKIEPNKKTAFLYDKRIK